jgi:hypothetical protein
MDVNQKIVKGVQASVEMELLESGELPLAELEALVRNKATLYLNNFVPKSKRNEYQEEKVVSQVVINCSRWTPQIQLLSDPTDHDVWLNSERKKNWVYWESYQQLLSEYLDDDAIDNLDESSDKILEQLEDPKRTGSWDRRGLVVGHVQSGKTGNYTGVITKAADAGYKIIIVLAGMHNNLRAQTQLRIESGFIGYETDIEGLTGKLSGVGNFRDESFTPNAGTNRAEKGDFNKNKAKTLSGISPEEKPWIFVIKKNKSVLEHLLRWIKTRVSDSVETGTDRRIVTKLPLLVIDDEADNASIDTKEQSFGPDGKVDEQHNPTAINSLIRQIMHSFSRKAYIGYTATPFANVFIHNKSETKKEGRDLFPSSFIVNLSAPSNYVGPSAIFSEQGQRLFIKEIDDFVDSTSNQEFGWMPNKHKSEHVSLYQNEDVIPPSLIIAINSFFLASSVRYLRGEQNAHWSMLVHVTRYTKVQSVIVDQIKKHLKHIKQKLSRGIGHEKFLRDLKELWDNDFCKVTEELLPCDNSEKYEDIKKKHFINDLPNWDEVLDVIPDVINDIRVLTINGKAKEALAYEEHKKLGLKVIAVGGDKLSRGLTLEGLTTSYFLRASKMYDTLMQMGRWFGYRPRYFDLCRLYTTPDLVDWFSKIAEANEELREEFELMASEGMSPHEFGLKVQSHPGLLITSPMKMRTATTLKLSFSGTTAETVVFSKCSLDINSNLNSMTNLLKNIEDKRDLTPKYLADEKEKLNGLLYKNVNSSRVIEFLENYKTHPDSYKSNSDLLVRFIEDMNRAGELTNWTVAVYSGSKENKRVDCAGENLFATRRKPNSGSDRYKSTIGRLLDPKHELVDVSPAQYSDAYEKTKKDFLAGKTKHKNMPEQPSNSIIRFIKGVGGETSKATPENGLLMLYLLEIRKIGTVHAESVIPAFAVSFPSSKSGVKVSYAVNNVWKEWEGEFGGSE